MLYRRLLSEVLLYLRQHPSVQNWQAVVLYPSSAVEVPEPALLEFLDTFRVQVIYLNELEALA